MDPNGIPVCYEDEYSKWLNLYSLIDSFLPIKEIQFNLLDFIKQTSRNLNIKFFPFSMQIFESEFENPINEYKKPYISLYIISFENFEINKDIDKEKIQQFISYQTSNRIEWMLVFIPPKLLATEDEYRISRKIYEKIDEEFNTKKEKGLKRVFPIYLFEKKIFSVSTSEYVNTFMQHFAILLKRSIESRFKAIDDTINQMLERKDSNDWSFLKFFALKENLALILEKLGFLEEAFQKYEELRNLYYECLLISPNKLKFNIEEYYLKKPNINPILTNIDAMPYRKMIYNEEITEFTFIQYLFAKQAIIMKKLNWHRDGIERVKHFIAEIFTRSSRELNIDLNFKKYMIFRCIWTYQAANGFLEIFQPKTMILDINLQNELNINIINVKILAGSCLAKLFKLLYDSETIELLSFNNELDILLKTMNESIYDDEDENNQFQEKLLSKEKNQQHQLINEMNVIEIHDSKLRDVIYNKEDLVKLILEGKKALKNLCLQYNLTKQATCIHLEILKIWLDYKKYNSFFIEIL